MSQFDFGAIDEDTTSGTDLGNNILEPWRDALNSMHSGSSRPSYAVANMLWVNTTTANKPVLTHFDGTDDIPLMEFDWAGNTIRVLNLKLPTARTDALPVFAFQEASPAYVLTSGAANAYTATPAPAHTAYPSTMFLFVKWNHTNTGNATLAINGLSAKAIKDIKGNQLPANTLVTNEISLLFYNGTEFILLSSYFPSIATQNLNMNGFALYSSGIKKITAVSKGSGTHTIDYSLGNYQKITATGNFTLAFSNLPATNVPVFLIEAVNWGAHTVTFPSGSKFHNSAAIVQSASGTDMLAVFKDDAGNYVFNMFMKNIGVPS